MHNGLQLRGASPRGAGEVRSIHSGKLDLKGFIIRRSYLKSLWAVTTFDPVTTLAAVPRGSAPIAAAKQDSFTIGSELPLTVS